MSSHCQAHKPDADNGTVIATWVDNGPIHRPAKHRLVACEAGDEYVVLHQTRRGGSAWRTEDVWEAAGEPTVVP